MLWNDSKEMQYKNGDFGTFNNHTMKSSGKLLARAKPVALS